MGNVTQLPVETEALPCPFCGEPDPDFEFSSEAQEDAWIQCQGCLCQGPVATIGCRDDDDGEIDLVAEATELWNKRVRGDQLPPLNLKPLAIVENRTLLQRIADGDAEPAPSAQPEPPSGDGIAEAANAALATAEGQALVTQAIVELDATRSTLNTKFYGEPPSGEAK